MVRLYASLQYISNVYKQQPQSKVGTVLLVVFPEYSIPLEHLTLVKTWVAANTHLSPVVFAGTHTLPAKTPENKTLYTELGVPIDDLRTAYHADLSTHAVLPVFSVVWPINTPPTVNTRLFVKAILSPFEMTNMAPYKVDDPKLDAILADRHVPAQPVCDGKPLGSPITVMPLICSEALQLSMHGTHPKCDLFVIPAYSQPDPFIHVVEQLSRNQHLVLLSNDGRYGGSRNS